MRMTKINFFTISNCIPLTMVSSQIVPLILTLQFFVGMEDHLRRVRRVWGVRPSLGHGLRRASAGRPPQVRFHGRSAQPGENSSLRRRRRHRYSSHMLVQVCDFSPFGVVVPKYDILNGFVWSESKLNYGPTVKRIFAKKFIRLKNSILNFVILINFQLCPNLLMILMQR